MAVNGKERGGIWDFMSEKCFLNNIYHIYSDESSVWKSLTESEKKALNYANKADGEFWYFLNIYF